MNLIGRLYRLRWRWPKLFYFIYTPEAREKAKKSPSQFNELSIRSLDDGVPYFYYRRHSL
jgi:hypothetical protein